MNTVSVYPSPSLKAFRTLDNTLGNLDLVLKLVFGQEGGLDNLHRFLFVLRF